MEALQTISDVHEQHSNRHDYFIEPHEGLFLAYNPKTGSFSTLDEIELVAFHAFMNEPDDPSPVINWYRSLTEGDEEYALLLAEKLINRLTTEGWKRQGLPPDSAVPLTSVYFTVTRECDLACPYCYQGLRNRKRKEMKLEHAIEVLDKIYAFNPECHIIMTGGEPMMHPHFFDILDHMEQIGIYYGMLTNGSFVNEEAAVKFSKLKYLRKVQLSLDGIKPETHALSRTKANYHKVIAALDFLEKYNVPFIVAPTMHEGNVDEIVEIADLAVGKGGWISPNNLMKLPQDENKNLSLSNESLQQSLKKVDKLLIAKYGRERLAEIKLRVETKNVCSVSAPNSKFICGTGWALLDIDWNGEVYPCHLMKEREMILGNIVEQSFADIFANSIKKRARVFSHEIEKCSSCKFISKCGGGCRAGAYYNFGTTVHESDLCDVNYAMNLKNALVTHPSYSILHSDVVIEEEFVEAD